MRSYCILSVVAPGSKYQLGYVQVIVNELGRNKRNGWGWGPRAADPESSANFSRLEFGEMLSLAIVEPISLYAPIPYSGELMVSRGCSPWKVSESFKFGV